MEVVKKMSEDGAKMVPLSVGIDSAEVEAMYWTRNRRSRVQRLVKDGRIRAAVAVGCRMVMGPE